MITGAYILSVLAIRTSSAPWGNVLFTFVPVLWPRAWAARGHDTVPLLAAQVARTWMDVLTAVNLLGISQFVPQMTRRLAALEEARAQRLPSVPLAAIRWGFLAVLASIAVGAVVVGLRQHAHHRVLMRRIAALKGAV